MGLLGSRGDCVYGTTIAHQIKKDFPGCHLTWAIAEQNQDILHNNPHVDEVWPVVTDVPDSWSTWSKFAHEAMLLGVRGVFDRVFLPQICPGNYQNYDGTVRPSLFRGYGRPITVPVRGHVILDEAEKRTVQEFISAHNIPSYRHRILFECGGASGQTHMTLEHALEAALIVVKALPDACCVMSSHLAIESPHKNIIAANTVSYRGNLELAGHCTLLAGCSSGVSALVATCADQNPLPTIQFVRGSVSVYASMLHDFAHWQLDTHNFMEMRDTITQETADAIIAICKEGFQSAKARFHQEPVVHFKHYSQTIIGSLINAGRFTDAARSLSLVAERYGWRKDIIGLSKLVVAEFSKEQFLLREAHVRFMYDFAKRLLKSIRSGI